MKTNKKPNFTLLFVLALFIIISLSGCNSTATDKENKCKYTDCKVKTFVGTPSESSTDSVSKQVNNWLLGKNSLIEIIDIQICDISTSYRSVILIVYREVIN